MANTETVCYIKLKKMFPIFNFKISLFQLIFCFLWKEVAQGHRVLCCAPSNVAVDNLLDKLSKNRIRVLRLGHPARLNQDLVKHSLDAVLSQSDQTQLVITYKQDCRYYFI